ncbi:MAG: lipase family protein [Clostridia bacterium]|nr:lipase family protein [Clostridia bacterium]
MLYELFSECVHIPYAVAGCCANYAVRRGGDVLYIFFEKSDGAADWKSNLDFPAKAYKRMDKTAWFAHRGFLAVWKEIEPTLAPHIADASIRKIVITGYSHGAAVAVLCHEYVWYNRPDLRETVEGYGFGCPRVFWGIPSPNLKRRFENFTVIRNIDDLVTHLPPRVFGYSHVGKLLKIGKKRKYCPIDAHKAENIAEELKAYEKQSTRVRNGSVH